MDRTNDVRTKLEEIAHAIMTMEKIHPINQDQAAFDQAEHQREEAREQIKRATIDLVTGIISDIGTIADSLKTMANARKGSALLDVPDKQD